MRGCRQRRPSPAAAAAAAAVAADASRLQEGSGWSHGGAMAREHLRAAWKAFNRSSECRAAVSCCLDSPNREHCQHVANLGAGLKPGVRLQQLFLLCRAPVCSGVGALMLASASAYRQPWTCRWCICWLSMRPACHGWRFSCRSLLCASTAEGLNVAGVEGPEQPGFFE
jgi:hypothetical protein